MRVSEILRNNAERLVALTKKELEIRLQELDDRFHAKTLDQIFVEERIYKKIEEEETEESVERAVMDGFKPFLKKIRGSPSPPTTSSDSSRSNQAHFAFRHPQERSGTAAHRKPGDGDAKEPEWTDRVCDRLSQKAVEGIRKEISALHGHFQKAVRQGGYAGDYR